MKYLYNKKAIDSAIKRIRRFKGIKVSLTKHFAGGTSAVIEVNGIDDYTKKGYEKVQKINKILEQKFGKDAYLECYDYFCHYFCVGETKQPTAGTKYSPIVLDGKNYEKYPDKVFLDIQRVWKELAEKYGDKGTCVLGEKFEFTYKKKHYVMEPLDNLQGSSGREQYIDAVQHVLETLGCKDVRFNYGFMD